jgi:hypothetical protein
MIHQASQGLASLGRNGDSMLVHMSPNEVAGLQGLAMAQGGSLTINPDTGLPEAFNLGNFFSSFLPTIAGMAFAPATGGASLTLSGMAPIVAGAVTGAGLAAIKGDDPLMGGLTGGLGGFGGAQLKGPLSAAADPAATAASKAFSAVGDTVSNINPSNLMGSTNITAGLPTTGGMGININNASQAGINQLTGGPGIQWSQAANAVANPEFVNQVATSLPQASIDNTFKGIQNMTGLGKASISDAYGAFKLAGGTPTELALPIGQAALSGLEPSDLYGDPFKPKEDKYDPYSALNLSGDTGLRLYATGGDVYANQSSIASGGLQSLYGSSDSSGGRQPLSQDGYGIGRLGTLTAEGSRAKAADTFYAGGGAIAFDKGGETSNKDVMMTASLGNPWAAYGVNPDDYDGYLNKIAGLAGAIKDKIPFAEGGYLNGGGDGMSDSIPATIEGKQPARLADGEFVIPADVVSHLGNGSSKAGSKRLYKMLDKVRHARTGTKKQGREINPNKYLPA